MTEPQTYTRADLRLKLRELKTATAPELAAALGVPHLAGRIISSLCDIERQGGVWLERAGRDGKKVIWRYDDVVERNLKPAAVAPRTPVNPTRLAAPQPPAPQSAQPSTALRWAVAGLAPLLDELVDRVAADVEKRVGKRLGMLEATLQRLEAERLSPQQLRALLAADLGALERRLYSAFGGPVEAPTTPTSYREVFELDKPEEAPARCRRPRVLVYRVDAVKAQELRKEFGDRFDIEVETDMSSNHMVAKRYAERSWDHVVLTTRMLGHEERGFFERSALSVAFANSGFLSVKAELHRFLVSRESFTSASG